MRNIANKQERFEKEYGGNSTAPEMVRMFVREESGDYKLMQVQQAYFWYCKGIDEALQWN